MTVITKITTQQKNQDRFNIFLDDEFAFSVDSDVLIKFELRKGMELDEFGLLEIRYHDDIRKAYNLAINLLAKRMRSEKEISDYLKKKEIEEPVIHEIIHKLSAQNYLNNEEFAIAYVRTQVNTTDKGPVVIKMELKEKGIAEVILEKALRQFSIDDQIEKAIKLAGKFFSKNSRDSERVARQKLESLLTRKGYPFDIIQIAIIETVPEKDSDEEMEAVRYQGEKLMRKYSKYSGFEFGQKMKQGLYQKGFPFELIERYLDEIKNHG